MGKVVEYTFLKQRDTKVYEKMSNFTNHQKNANQNHNEMSRHICHIISVFYFFKNQEISGAEYVEKLEALVGM